MLKLASSGHWKAATILSTHEPKFVCFAHFPINPTCSPTHLFSFVISLEDFFIFFCQGQSSCSLMTAPRVLQVPKGNSCGENHGCCSEEMQIVGSETVRVAPGEKTAESGKEPRRTLIRHMLSV